MTMIHLASSAYKSFTAIFGPAVAPVETKVYGTGGASFSAIGLDACPEPVKEAISFSMQLSNLQQSLHRAGQPAISFAEQSTFQA